VVTPYAKREAVNYLKAAYGVSERRACSAMAFDRSTVRYESKRPDDAELRDQVKKIARERRRFSYRRIQVLLEREGIHLNLRQLCRI
jgi:putative transposase